jgi:hypothetical protein
LGKGFTVKFGSEGGRTDRLAAAAWKERESLGKKEKRKEEERLAAEPVWGESASLIDTLL